MEWLPMLTNFKNAILESRIRANRGQSLVELLLAFGIMAIFLPALATGIISSRNGTAQESQRLQAVALVKEAKEATRNVREKGWVAFAVNGTYHPTISGSEWALVSGPEDVNGFTRQIVISDVSRDASGTIVDFGGTVDPSTKKAVITVSWTKPLPANLNSTVFLTRYLDNLSCLQTTHADFNAGTINNTAVTNSAGGEVILGNNTKAKWCSPELSGATIDLPDGPPVAVAATSSATSNLTPNGVFVAIAPYATSSAKLAYLTVSANTDPPVPTLKGTFTLDPSKYSAPELVPTGINLDNNFSTNSVAYYRSNGGNLYALLATTKPDREVIVIRLTNGETDTYQDPTNKIYAYWTYFNTRIYQGNNSSTPNQDQAPFGYGGKSVRTLGNTGYVTSGGYLYAFDLINIDSATTAASLPMVGCRIQLDGYDCQPGNGTDRKYSAGQTGASWSDTTSPVHNDCSDGGNVELYANNDIYPIIASDGKKYVFVAVGAGTNPEFNIVNVNTPPTSGSALTGSSCGRISGGSANWKRVGSLDFNSQSNTEEAANSVFSNADGSRAYISSNGGIDGNNNGQPDSHQFYVVNTSNKSSPTFLTGNSSTGATSGYYNGDTSNIQMFPRRSLTVLNGQRVVLVGKDGLSNDETNPKDYQVLNLSNESSPNYCGGVDYDAGFNDLTSVIEADHDTFVYMVANTDDKELKIIQGGPDGTYNSDGDFTSSACVSSFSTAFNNFTSSIAQPSNTSLQMQVAVAPMVSGSCTGANYNFVGPGGSSSTFFTPVGASISGAIPFGTFGTYQNPSQCFKYKLFLSTTDYNTTPTLYDVTTNYSP